MFTIHNLMRRYRIWRLQTKLARHLSESATFVRHIGADDEHLQVERFLQIDREIQEIRAQLAQLSEADHAN